MSGRTARYIPVGDYQRPRRTGVGVLVFVLLLIGAVALVHQVRPDEARPVSADHTSTTAHPTAQPTINSTAIHTALPHTARSTTQPAPFAPMPTFSTAELVPELEQFVKQEEAMSLFDSSRCFPDHTGEWDDQALRRVYRELLVPASRAMNLDVYAEDVLAFQCPYACVQEAERLHRLWGAQRHRPPRRILLATQGTLSLRRNPPELLQPFRNTRVPGMVSCDLLRSNWHDFLQEGRHPMTPLLWLFGFALNWDCDLLLSVDNVTSAWTEEYDLMLHMTAFGADEWFGRDEKPAWRSAWVDQFAHDLEYHSPVLLSMPHEPHMNCGGGHYPPLPPFCPVFLDNYACLGQPVKYLGAGRKQARPSRSLSTLLHYHYDVRAIQATFASSNTSREVVWSAQSSEPPSDAKELFEWLEKQGFVVHSHQPVLRSASADTRRSQHQNLHTFARQKYGILTTERQSAGQVAVELAMFGVPVFITQPKLFHRLVHHPWLMVHTLSELRTKIDYLESHARVYEQLRAYTLARVRFVDVSNLPDAAQIAMRVHTTLEEAERSHTLDAGGRVFVDNNTHLAVWHWCTRRE